MESVLTVRLDSAVKEQGSEIMRRLGTTPSRAVRELFDYAIKNDALPFAASSESSEADIVRRIRAFDCCHMKEPLSLSDDELREERLEARYGSDA